MRGSPQPHPALIVSSCTKRAYAVTTDTATVRILEASEGEYRLFEVPICEYAMRGSPRPHSALIVFTNTNCSHGVMFDISTVRISEAPGVNIAYWRSHFVNT